MNEPDCSSAYSRYAFKFDIVYKLIVRVTLLTKYFYRS